MTEILQQDLTKTVGRFLDKHFLIVNIFDFLEENKIYPENEIKKAKLELLSSTHMADFAIEIYKGLFGVDTAPEEMEAQRNKVHADHKILSDKAEHILNVVENDDLLENLRAAKNFNLEYLKEHHQITEEHVKDLYNWAKFNYECGAYDDAVHLLSCFRELSTDADLLTTALWGKLAAEIVTGNWEVAVKDLATLKEQIDSRMHVSTVQQLQQRTWLIHWALLVFFLNPSDKTSYIEWFNDRYFNAVQMTCPHILRYLAASSIYRKVHQDDVVRLIEQEKYKYSDAFTEFFEALYINFDLEDAEEKIREYEKICDIDPFLKDIKEVLVENGKALIERISEKVRGL